MDSETEKQNQPSNMPNDHFTRLMFGSSRQINRANTENIQPDNNPKKSLMDHELFSRLDQVDYDELMKNIDVFITSTKEFKPIVKKFSPLIERFLSQNKDE